MAGYTAATIKAKLATVGMSAAVTAANFAFAALASYFIGGAITAWKDHQRAIEDAANAAKEAAEKINEAKKSFTEFEDKYNSLAKNGKSDWNYETFQEAKSIQEDIIKLFKGQSSEMDTLLSKIDLANGKYAYQKQLLSDIAVQNAKDNSVEYSKSMTGAKSKLEKNTFGFWSGVFDNRGDKTSFSMDSSIDNKIADYLEKELGFGNRYGEHGNSYTVGNIDWSNAGEIVKFYNKLSPAIDGIVEKYKDEDYQESKIYQNLIALQSALKDNVSEYQAALKAYNKNEAFVEMADAIKKLNKEGKNIDTKKAFDELKESLIGSGGYLTDYQQALLEVINETFPQFSNAATNAADSVSAASKSIEDVNKLIDSLQSNYSTLNSAVQEYNKYGALSIDTLQSLLSMDYEYITCLQKSGNGLTLNMTKMQELAKARLLDAESAAIDKAITELNNIAAELYMIVI